MLHGTEAISHFLRQNQVPIHYVSTSLFNLIGVSELVGNLAFIHTVDSYAGAHPRMIVPAFAAGACPTAIDQASTALLSHPESRAYLRNRGGGVLFLMCEPAIEALLHDLGLRLVLPPIALRQRLDNKIEATQRTNAAGIESVPHCLAHVSSYQELCAVAADLGPQLVIQLPYGDSGTTTFFVASEADFAAHAAEICAQPLVKIMRRIRCQQATIEGCVTRAGTLVGPLMTELVGFAELTPYRGGWCGNEAFGHQESTLFSPALRQQARQMTEAIGEQLRAQGYWGVFGVDFLIDQSTGRLYLGELNPRVTGTTPLTSLMARAHGQIPLILYHLLEWLGCEYDLDPAHVNAIWADAMGTVSWSQLIVEHTDQQAAQVIDLPQTGIWQLRPDQELCFVAPSFDPHQSLQPDQAFLFRTINPGETATAGRSLVRLLLHGRLMDDHYRLNARAQAWIQGCRQLCRTMPVAG